VYARTGVPEKLCQRTFQRRPGRNFADTTK
jgi:hypothetical protein